MRGEDRSNVRVIQGDTLAQAAFTGCYADINNAVVAKIIGVGARLSCSWIDRVEKLKLSSNFKALCKHQF